MNRSGVGGGVRVSSTSTPTLRLTPVTPIRTPTPSPHTSKAHPNPRRTHTIYPSTAHPPLTRTPHPLRTPPISPGVPPRRGRLAPERRHIPHADGLVEGGAGHDVFLGVESGAHDVVVVAGQDGDAGAGLPVPYANGLGGREGEGGVLITNADGLGVGWVR